MLSEKFEPHKFSVQEIASESLIPESRRIVECHEDEKLSVDFVSEKFETQELCTNVQSQIVQDHILTISNSGDCSHSVDLLALMTVNKEYPVVNENMETVELANALPTKLQTKKVHPTSINVMDLSLIHI